MNIQTVSLSAQGASPGLVLLDRPESQMATMIYVNLSPGASIIYNIELSGDNIHWNVSDNALNLSANINYRFDGLFGYVRVNITSYISGTLTASFCQT